MSTKKITNPKVVAVIWAQKYNPLPPGYVVLLDQATKLYWWFHSIPSIAGNKTNDMWQARREAFKHYEATCG